MQGSDEGREQGKMKYIIASDLHAPKCSQPLMEEVLAELTELLDLLGDVADIVIVDSPPVLPVADSLSIAAVVDATVLVARSRTSSRRAVQRAVEVLQRVNAPLVGAVLNDVDVDAAGYGYGRYGYQPRGTERRQGADNGAGKMRATAPMGPDRRAAGVTSAPSAPPRPPRRRTTETRFPG